MQRGPVNRATVQGSDNTIDVYARNEKVGKIEILCKK